MTVTAYKPEAATRLGVTMKDPVASYPHKNAKVRACALLTELYSKLPCYRAGGGAESGAGTHKSGPFGVTRVGLGCGGSLTHTAHRL